MSPVKSARDTKAARTRERILDAAARELAEHGYSGSSLRRVAGAAELKPGSLYFHFKTKDELMLTVLREGIAFATLQVQTAIDELGPNAPPSARLRAAIGAHIESLCTAGARGAAVARGTDTLPPSVHRRYANHARGYARLWNDLLDTAQRTREIDPALDVRILRDLLFSAMNGTLAQRGQSAGKRDQAAATLTTLLLRT
jgi:AcrR family transcriptional regulator